MSYATQDDLVAAFGQDQLLLIADRDNDQVLDDAVIDQAIASADAMVDLAVRGLYAVPLSPVDPEIVDIVCDLARLRLYGYGTQVPEEVKDAAKAAQSLLDDISTGAKKLTAAIASSTPATEGELNVQTESDDPVFTMDTLKGF